MDFNYRIESTDGISIVYLAGKLLGREQTEELNEKVENLILGGNYYIAIDLSELTHMNSTGLNILITYLTKARNAGGELAIINVQESIKKLLIITKLNNVFTLPESLEAAMEMLKRAAGTAEGENVV